jgi:hypothetical protein
VALTEVEALSDDEIVLQEVGRDLRPDTITTAPDVTSSGAAALNSLNELPEQVDVSGETVNSTPSAPDSTDAATVGNSDDEKQNASDDAAE